MDPNAMASLFEALDTEALSSLVESVTVIFSALQTLLTAGLILGLLGRVASRIGFGIAVKRLARRKGYRRSFFWGFFFEVFALIYIAGLPDNLTRL